jgi:hypothetical protein
MHTLCVLVHSVNFAFLLRGNVGFGFIFSLQVEGPYWFGHDISFKVLSCYVLYVW